MPRAGQKWSVAVGALLSLVVVLLPLQATGVTTLGWAQWTPLTGTTGAFATTMALPAAGFPVASVTSTSRSGGVGVQTGASVWLGPSTPVGAAYGSSQNLPYLNLRLLADSAASPSVTTYTFARPTPPGGWTFVLGDIDADFVEVRALGIGGQPLSGAELGFRGGFNYCAMAPRPPCTGSPTDITAFDPATGRLTGSGLGDTSGAAGWFEPTVPVTSLTFVFHRLAGFPVYQTWFASRARDIGGTVQLQGAGPLGDATLRLFGQDGSLLATTTSAANGTYAFPGYTAANGYTVEVSPPPWAPGYVVVGPDTVPVSLAVTDAIANFVVRAVVPVSVSGTVSVGGEPVSGVVVSAAGPGGPLTAVSGGDGGYVIGGLVPGEYTLAVEPPAGFVVVSGPGPVLVPVGAEGPITGQDFVVRAVVPVSVSGTVSVGGEPVSGVVVSAAGPGGPLTAVTGGDGGYVIGGLVPGEYTLAVEPPAGFTVVSGPGPVLVPVGAEGPITGQDFVVRAVVPVSVSGTVTVGGEPVPGVVVSAAGPGGPLTAVTGADGGYVIGGLVPGEYTLAVEPPAGYLVVGTGQSDVVVVGSDVTGVDFAVRRPGTIAGHLLDDDGAPVAGATIVVSGASGDVSLVTDDDGAYLLANVASGDYRITVVVPDGYTVDRQTRTVTVTDLGEDVTGQDFVVTPEAVEPPPTEPPPTEPPPTEPPPTEPPGPTTSPPLGPAPFSPAPFSPAPFGPGMLPGASPLGRGTVSETLPATGASGDLAAGTAVVLVGAGAALVLAAGARTTAPGSARGRRRSPRSSRGGDGRVERPRRGALLRTSRNPAQDREQSS